LTGLVCGLATDYCVKGPPDARQAGLMSSDEDAIRGVEVGGDCVGHDE
jgi:hypothetical protein